MTEELVPAELLARIAAVLVLGVGVVDAGIAARRGVRGAALLLRLAVAFALAAALAPPRWPFGGERLVVLAPGAERVAATPVALGSARVALPGSGAAAAIATAPDLATALARAPQATQVQVIGAGLPPRDLDALAGRRLALSLLAPPAQGLIALEMPERVALGHAFRVRGRAAADVQRVLLLDPAGQERGRVWPAGDGRFALAATADVAGLARFRLRALAADGAVIDEAVLPVVIDDTRRRLRLRWLAATPDAEGKFWRRWAVDAGAEVQLSAALGGGVVVGDGHGDGDRDGEGPQAAAGPAPARPGVLSAAGAAAEDAPPDPAPRIPEALAGLDPLDALIVDDRVWAAFTAEEQAQLLAAVDAGLGLLLRASGPLPAAVAEQWAALGFAITPQTAVASLRLAADRAPDEPVPLLAAPVRLDADPDEAADAGAVALSASAAGPAAASPHRAERPVTVLADDGSTLIRIRGRGRGAVGVSRLLDSYRLVLGGAAATHGALWADVLAAVARPPADATPPAAMPPPAPLLPLAVWAGERTRLCGLPAVATLLTPAGEAEPLPVDDHGCAWAWPAEGGWHQVLAGAHSTPWHVRSAGDAAGLRAARDVAALQARIDASPEAPPPAHRPGTPTPRAAWLLLWLLLASTLWWREMTQVPAARPQPDGRP